jgi:hypothetical protein
MKREVAENKPTAVGDQGQCLPVLASSLRSGGSRGYCDCDGW